MNNPFLSYSEEYNCEYLSSVCSINRVVVAKPPLEGVDDSIKGKSAMEFFSTPVIVNEIKKQAKARRLDISEYCDSDLPKFLNDGILCTDARKKRVCNDIAIKFGNRLGLLLLTLKTALEENKAARTDWTDEHWNYWKNVKTVILVGGLASGMLGRRFKECIHNIFDMANVKPYNIMLFESGSHVGVMGCATLIKEEDSYNVIFDFGQTNTKRSLVVKKNGEITEIKTLPTLPSVNMQTDIIDRKERLEKAYELHKHIVNIITDTYREAQERYDVSDEIIISIANYNIGDRLSPKRGGYAKLCDLSDEYGKLLAHDLSGSLRKEVKIRLVHDATAVALYFKDYENSVCLTLGTAFGVGFPQMNL